MANKYGKWVVQDSLSEGGQAHTFKVYAEGDPKKTIHVLKRLKNRNRIKRFLSEIEVVRGITNPYIAKIIDFNADVDKPYLVMPFYTRGTLANMPCAEMSVIDTLSLFRKVCLGGTLRSRQRGCTSGYQA